MSDQNENENFDYTYGVVVIIHATAKPREGTSAINNVELHLETADTTQNNWLNSEGEITRQGVKPLSLALIQGLYSNIVAAHAMNFWEKEQHYLYVLAELKRAYESEIGFIVTDQ